MIWLFFKDNFFEICNYNLKIKIEMQNFKKSSRKIQ